MRDGYRESKQPWAELLRDLKRRGLAAPVVAVGDGALGFWAALRDVYPTTREQRCWLHRTLNVLDTLPDRLQQGAKTALHRIADAEGREAALDVVRRFTEQFADGPKATAKITEDLDTLLAYYDYPREHWVHLRTINPIESTLATVRLRQRVTKGPGSREAGLTMYQCGACDTVLVKDSWVWTIRNIAFKCPGCGAYNVEKTGSLLP